MLTIWMYTSMINPIKKLQTAAQNIKDGNLDFSVESDSRDEIGELCRSFEEMRLRLKDNAEEKIEGEKENKTLISNIRRRKWTVTSARFIIKQMRWIRF